MGRLRHDDSAAAVARAAVTYNMIVEGRPGRDRLPGLPHDSRAARDILPGICRGVRLLRQDESRHIAYGVHLLSRLVAEGGPRSLAGGPGAHGGAPAAALGVVHEMFSPYDPIPFAVDPEQFLGFAMTQFQYRWSRIEKAGTDGFAESDLDAEEGTIPP